MDYLKRVQLKISMKGYLREVLDDLQEETTGRSETPAATHIFEVRSGEERVLLDELRARAFHHSVAQLLFTSTRCRKDIQMEVALIKTWVKGPDEDDW